MPQDFHTSVDSNVYDKFFKILVFKTIVVVDLSQMNLVKQILDCKKVFFVSFSYFSARTTNFHTQQPTHTNTDCFAVWTNLGCWLSLLVCQSDFSLANRSISVLSCQFQLFRKKRLSTKAWFGTESLSWWKWCMSDKSWFCFGSKLRTLGCRVSNQSSHLCP